MEMMHGFTEVMLTWYA